MKFKSNLDRYKGVYNEITFLRFKRQSARTTVNVSVDFKGMVGIVQVRCGI